MSQAHVDESPPPEPRRPLPPGDEQFRLLVEAVQDYAICMLDPDGRVVSWNAGAARLKGYRAEEIIGSHFGRFYTPEDLERGHPDLELQTAQQEGRFAEEGWRLRKDGSRFWAHVVITPVHEAGKLVGFAKVTRDLTARRDAQEASRRLLLAETARADAERTAETLHRLQLISEIALSHAGLDELLAELLERLRELFQADSALILLREGELLSVRAGVGVDMATLGAERVPVGAGFAGRIAAEGRPLVLTDVQPGDLASPTLWEQGLRSLLGVPLWVEGRVTGVLHVGMRQQRTFSREDAAFLQLAADRAALAIQNAQLFREAQEAAERLLLLAEASTSVLPGTDASRTVPTLLTLAQQLLHADAYAVWRQDPATGIWRVIAQLHLSESYPLTAVPSGFPLPDRPFVIADILTAEMAEDRREAMRAEGIRSLLCCPMRLGQARSGSIVFYRRSHEPFTEADLQVASALGSLAGAAIDNARLHEDAQHALAAARRSAARARRLMESNSIGIHVGRVGGVMTEANDAFLALVGRSRAELEEGALWWGQLTAPDHRGREQGARAQLRASGVCAPYETVLLRADGLRVPALVGAACFEDQPEEAVTFVLDLSERRRLEEGVRFAMEHARCLLWHAYVDAPTPENPSYQWDLHFFDEQAAQRFLPLERLPDESYAQALDRWKPEEDHRMADATARAAFEANLRGYEQEYRCRRADGELRWLHERTYLERISPTRWRAVGVCTEVTQRKRLEQELRDRVEELAAEDQRKDEFLAMLAHELRNPLGAVSNAVHLLRQPGTSAAQRGRALEVLQRQVAHQSRLVEDLLDVSRIERGLVELRLAPLDLVQLAAHAVEDWRPPLEREGLRLTARLPEAPVHVEGDPTRLTQVLGNLLSNAGKFTPPGGEITVGVVAEAEAAVLRVRDTGAGIDAELLPRVFESFTQSDHSLARSRGGLGLGLAIVHGLIQLHHGTVTAASAGAGQGTEIEIRLPCLPSPAVPECTKPVAVEAGGLRILVVEDNRDAAETLSDILELDGHEVELAFSGPTGVAAARRLRPDVVLCDIGLPGMDGYQVAVALRGDASLAGTRLVAVTGYGQDEDRRRSREAGFDAHLTKPVDIVALQRVLAEK